MSLLTVEKKLGFAIIILNDPDRRNVFSGEMSNLINATFDALESDDEMRCAILTGAGSAFCAGGHLDELLATKTTDDLHAIYQGFVRIANSKLATIAAVNGPAVGAGLNAALACDVVIAAESATFDARFLQIAIGPGGGNTWRLSKLASLQTANAMILFGELLDGHGAVSAGLAWKCVPDSDLVAESCKVAERAAKVPRELLFRTKQTIANAQRINDLQDAIDNEITTQHWSMQQPEFHDAVGKLQARIKAKPRKQ